MVGITERTVSPSSSSTRRSTPCVLGCCGPMLTVRTSVRRSGIRLPFDELADRVQQRAVDFLRPRGRRRRHVDVDVGRRAHGAAVAAGQRHGRERRCAAPPRTPRGRSATRRWSRCRSARRPRGRSPPPGGRRPSRTRSRWRSPSGSTCPSSARSTPAPGAPARSARPARRRSAAHRRRCRRCRTPGSSRRARSAAIIASAAATVAATDEDCACSCRRADAVERRRHDLGRRWRHALSPRACRSLLDVRPELLLGHLERLVQLHRACSTWTG